ncbi:MAG: hypothetical protein ACRENK_11305, partial [Gemmatimonadaceae bacterium]
MAALRDEFEEILSAASARDQAAYATFLEGLTDADKGIVAAHLMFALLHTALAQFAAASREKSRPVSVDRSPYGSSVRIYTPHHAAVCTCWLQDDTVIVELLGGPTRADWRKPWKAPPDPEPAKLFAVVRTIAKEIAVHLV